MAKDSGYLVASVNGSAYVQAFGLANMTNTPMLDAFLNAELELGLTTVCIDFSSIDVASESKHRTEFFSI